MSMENIADDILKKIQSKSFDKGTTTKLLALKNLKIEYPYVKNLVFDVLMAIFIKNFTEYLPTAGKKEALFYLGSASDISDFSVLVSDAYSNLSELLKKNGKDIQNSLRSEIEEHNWAGSVDAKYTLVKLDKAFKEHFPADQKLNVLIGDIKTIFNDAEKEA